MPQQYNHPAKVLEDFRRILYSKLKLEGKRARSASVKGDRSHFTGSSSSIGNNSHKRLDTLTTKKGRQINKHRFFSPGGSLHKHCYEKMPSMLKQGLPDANESS